MKINGTHYRTIWLKENDEKIVQVIDQRFLPNELVIEELTSYIDTAEAIRDMHIRGAGLIGAAAGYGMYLAALSAPKHSNEEFDAFLDKAGRVLMATRPTAVNLEWAVTRSISSVKAEENIEKKILAARKTATLIADEDVLFCKRIGEYGLSIIEEISKKKNGATVNILTHCNAGWLAFVDYGTALSPIYLAAQKEIDLHVYVDETRPRNQGGLLSAYELYQNNIPHTVITDNAGGHIMQLGMVDMVIVGCDRATCTGDVANKIGTYLKAVAAYMNNVPFYVALPSSSIDWSIKDGLKEIPIEIRDENEIRYFTGMNNDKMMDSVLTINKQSNAVNYGFDVTPGRFIKALITEKGICDATEDGIRSLFPEKQKEGFHL